MIAALQGKRAVQVSAGDDHSLALLERGEVYSFGYGNHGQLGHGDEQNQLLPKLIAALQGKRVVQVSGGERHSLALLEGGEVYSFGCGCNGQLGHGDHYNQLAPKLIAATSTEQARAVEVAAGARWSLLLKEDGGVITRGGDRTGEDDGAW